MTTFVKPCQFMLDVAVGNPLYFNYHYDDAQEMCRRSRLKKSYDHYDQAIDPNLVSAGSYYHRYFGKNERDTYSPAIPVRNSDEGED